MLNKMLLSTAIVCAGATAGLAQGFTGASLGFEYTDFPDVDALGDVNYYGSVEFGITPDIAIAGDLAFYDFDVGDADISNFTLHGIYALNSMTKLGVYYGRDDVESETIDNYGVEAAYDFGFGSAQAYLGIGDDGEDELSYFGASADYGLGSGFSILGSFDRASLDDASSSRLELGGAYSLPAGVTLSAAIGSLTVDDGIVEVDENYFTIGASIGLGPQGGTTFGRRSAFESAGAANDFADDL